MAKSTKISILMRLEIIEELLLKSYTASQICRYMSEKHKISSRQVERYMKEVTDKWTDVLKKDIEGNAKLAIMQRDRLINKAEIKGDLRTMLAAMDSRDKLKGLLTETTINHKGSIQVNEKEDLGQLTDEQLKNYEKYKKIITPDIANDSVVN